MSRERRPQRRHKSSSQGKIIEDIKNVTIDLNMILKVTLYVVISTIISIELVTGQPAAQGSSNIVHQFNQAPAVTATSSSSSNNNNKQYFRSSSGYLVNRNSNQNNQENNQQPQSLSLTRQQQQQQAQIENVIESTPSSLTASLISIKTTGVSQHNNGNTNQHNYQHSHHSSHHQNHNNNHHNHNNNNHHHHHNPALPLVSPQASPISAPSNCQLPPTWAGRWYQSNKEPIRVTNTEISDKGICRDQKGDKYLFEYSGNINNNNKNLNQINSQPCLMCLVINERHLNVLQYKESNCQPIPANYFNRTSSSSNNIPLEEDHSLLESICSDITGDAQLESLFRLDTPAIECPITGQYAFTYDSCREPQSSLNSCIDKKELNFKFSACPDMPGSESKYEVLKCYADWSEGNNYYMIGRLEHASNNPDKGKFRCFVYEKSSDGKLIQMAQSLEESCYGLISANEGPKTLRLSARPPTVPKCNFPSYIQSQSENWLSVDNSLIYMFNQNSTKYHVKETKEGDVIEEATCLQQFSHNPQANSSPHLHPHQQQQQNSRNYNSNSNQAQQAIYRRHSSSSSAAAASESTNYVQADQSGQGKTNEIVYLVQITKYCHTKNYCVRFYRRSNGIVQIDYFAHVPGDTQCKNAFSVAPQTQIITSTNLEHQRCPFEGAYTIEAPIESDLSYNPSNIFICPRQSYLTSQCDLSTRLRVHSKCSPSSKLITKNLYCLGSWTTNGYVSLILADDERQRFSAWYKDYSGLYQNGQATADLNQQQLQDNSLSLDRSIQMNQQHQPLTRSQHILANAANQQMVNSIAPIIDLQIALITPLQVPTKPMFFRLTRQNHCSDLKGYSTGHNSPQQTWLGPQMQTNSPSIPSYYASSFATSLSSSPFSSISSPSSGVERALPAIFWSKLLLLSSLIVNYLLVNRHA